MSEFTYQTPKPIERQFSVVDRSARAPMKNAASCEKQCELQNTLIIGILNAHGGPDPPWPGPRSSEGRKPKYHKSRITHACDSDGNPHPQ